MTTINRVLPRELPLLERQLREPAPINEEANQADPHHDGHLAHHFASPKQQYEAAKFGMWLFLATEVLLFGGLFCLYAVLRSAKPEIFAYGSQFLQVEWGALNTAVLILSSLTMAWAVRAAQLNQRKTLISLLALTIAGGGAFMAVKYIEYSHKFHQNLVWGISFYDMPHAQHDANQELPAASASPIPQTAAPAVQTGDAVKGETLWMATCRSCHGVSGEGMPGQGKDIRGSEFIASKSDKELVNFIKAGRMPFDKLNTTGIQMPPKGGNPLLNDADLLNIVAHLRTFKAPLALAEPENPSSEIQSPTEAPPAESTPVEISAAQPSESSKEEFYIPKAIMPPAAAGPSGMLKDWENGGTNRNHDRTAAVDPRQDPNRPANVHLFFGVYFLMTGLHGLHVLIGMAFIGWLLVRAALGHFTSAYFTPVDLVGLYWHVVDLIWIFLFPLLYLIH